MRILDRVFLRFGVAIGVLLSQLLSERGERGPPLVDLFVVTATWPRIEIGAAARAVSLTIRPAQRVQRQLQCQRIAQHGLEVDHAVLDLIGILLERIFVARARIQLADLHLERCGKALQAAGAFERHRRRNRAGDEDAFDHSFEAELRVRRFLVEMRERGGNAWYRRIDHQVPVPAGPPEYLGYRDP